MITSVVEVFALCGFIFGVACKLPPSLTILILNGCFCFPIGCYLSQSVITYVRQTKEKFHNHQRHFDGYHKVEGDNIKETMKPVQQSPSSTEQDKEPLQLRRRSKYLTTTLEILGFLMQLGALVSIPILLSNEQFFSPSGRAKHYAIATYILIPVSLCIISMIWTGWIQNIIIRSSDAYNTATQSLSGEKDKDARLKTGNYN